MKKKIIYGLLFAVAMVTASSSFVSCKDYEGDDYAMLKEQLQKDADLISAIEAQLKAIKSCNCDATLADRVATIESDYLKAAALNGYATQEWVNQQGFTTLSDVQDWVGQQGFSTLTMQAVQNWVNEQGFLKEATSGLTEDQVKGIVNTILQQTLGENNKVISDMINTALANGENPYWTKNEIINYFNTNQPDLSGYATKEDINNLRNYIILGDSVKNAYEWANYAYQRVIAHSDSLKTIYSQTITNRDSIVILADSIDKVAAQALENFNTAKELADSAIKLANKALDSCNILDVKVADLETAMKEADQKLQDQIDALEERVAANEKSIQNITGTLKKQITSIEIQGTYNPVFGTFAIPTNTQSNVLAAFYGTAEEDVKFPAYQKKFYVSGESWISKAEWDAMGLSTAFEANAGDPLMAEEGNAGTLYVTVNPSNVDFTGTNFTLRTTDNKVSIMELSALEPANDEQLNFGYTRAGATANAANGFYKVKATVTDINAAAQLAPQFNIKSVGSDIVQVMKDVKATAIAAKNEHAVSGARAIVKDLANVVADVYANSSNILPRLGMQANWIDEVTGAKSVTSKYEIAATAIKPLGFGTLGKYWNLKGIDFTPTHQFIKYIDGKAIDKEIYDLIVENLKLELNLNLGLDINFEQLQVAVDPQNNVEFKVPVLGYNFKPDALWMYDDTNMRMELLVSDPSQPDGIAKNPDGTNKTSGIYVVVAPNGVNLNDPDYKDFPSDLGKDWIYLFNDSKTGWGIFSYDGDNNKDQWLLLDMTDVANVLLYGELKVDDDGNYVKDANGNYVYEDRNEDGVINTGIFGTLNEQLDKFNAHVDDINGMEDKIEAQVKAEIEKAMKSLGTNIYTSLSSLVSKYVKRVNNVIDRLNYYGNKSLDYLINDPDRYVQPILLSYSNGKLTLVGRSRLGASVANANDLIALQPTTTTLETVAPAFKKHLAISNVYNNKTGKNAVYDNDAAAKGVMTAANQAIGATEVIDGGTQEGIHSLKTFQIPANASGMTLEIVYTALGYDGKIAGKKFYIRVK